jgi:hypothetical protein
MPRILVTGSRTWTNGQIIRNALIGAWRELGDSILVVGGAPGADIMAERIWKYAGLPVERYPADWRPYGIYNPQAGKVRNQQMVDLGADLCLAFILRRSSGATDCAEKAEAAGIPVRYFREDTDAVAGQM